MKATERKAGRLADELGRKTQLDLREASSDQENAGVADEGSMRPDTSSPLGVPNAPVRPKEPTRLNDPLAGTPDPRTRGTRRRTDRSMQYRLPKPSIEPLAPETVQEEIGEVEEDYTPMVRGVLRAATTLFLGQALGSLVIANWLGGSLQIRFFLKFIPYVTILAPRITFVRIVTWATVFAVVLTCAMVLLGLVRHRREQQLLDGWSAGLLMSGLLVGFQYIRHLMDTPTIDGWIMAQTAAGVIAATVIYLGFRPEPDRSDESGRKTTVVERRGASQRRPNQQPVRDPARRKERDPV